MVHFCSRPRSQRWLRLALSKAEPKVKDEHKPESKPRVPGRKEGRGKEFAPERGQLSCWALERFQAEFSSWNKHYKRRVLWFFSTQWDKSFCPELMFSALALRFPGSHTLLSFTRFFFPFYISTLLECDPKMKVSFKPKNSQCCLLHPWPESLCVNLKWLKVLYKLWNLFL